MELKKRTINEGEFETKDYISPSYVNTKNPKYIEIDRSLLWRNHAC